MNKGVDKATGEWINFMNAGDSFVCDETIANVFDISVQNTNEILYGDTVLQHPVGNYYRNCSDGKWYHQSIFTPTYLMKRYHFDTHYKIMADEDFIRKCANDGIKLKYLPIPISRYECFCGLSSTHFIEMYIERAEIRGIDKDIYWQIKLMSMCIKRFLKKLLLWDKWHTFDFEKERARLEKNPRLKKI